MQFSGRVIERDAKKYLFTSVGDWSLAIDWRSNSIPRSLCLSHHVVFRRDEETRDDSTSSLLFFFSLSSVCVWYEKTVVTRILFYRKCIVNTHYTLLSSVANEKGDVGRVRLMALMLRAPAPTRSQRSLGHRYSQLFLTSPRMREYRLVSLELRRLCSIIQLFSKRSDPWWIDRWREGKKRKRQKKKIDSRDSFDTIEKVLKPVLLTLVVFHFSIRLRPRANRDDWEIILLLRKVLFVEYHYSVSPPPPFTICRENIW